MLRRTITWTAAACIALVASVVPTRAQIVEAVGARASGMGGAFVAVATDSSATWWNPAALADGPFFDLSIGRAIDERPTALPAGRDRSSGFALSTPVVGVSLYRFRLTDASAGVGPIDAAMGSREAEAGPVALRSLAVSAFGATVVQTVANGAHVGATLKYVRGTLRTADIGGQGSLDAALDVGQGLGGGSAESRFDLDLGALATVGPVRLGALVRNVRAPNFGDGAFELPRQARIGVAVAAEQVGGPPLTLAFDADLVEYRSGSGQRRVLAVGAEQWFAAKRLGVRAGARFNRVGRAERALTAGASLAVRAGTYLEGHVVGSRSSDERGWGVGMRVSF